MPCSRTLFIVLLVLLGGLRPLEAQHRLVTLVPVGGYVSRTDQPLLRALTDADNGVAFDIDADGRVDRVAWTERDVDVGFLVLDRNGNGVVDDGSELYCLTPQNGAEASKRRAQAGFSFDLLQIWVDRNHNGFSESSELIPITRYYGSIGGGTPLSQIYDQYGNHFQNKSRALVYRPGNPDEPQRPKVLERVVDTYEVVLAAR